MNGFEFSILENRSVRLNSDITDYTTEDNARIQDHIALHPIVISLGGFVGEVFEEKPKNLKYQQAVQSKLNELGGLAPQLSAQAQEYFNKAKDLKSKAEAVLDKVDNAINFLKDIETFSESEDNENAKIKNAYKVLFGLWKSKTEMTIKTDFADFSNMFIESVEFSKKGTEKYKSDISIILKQVKRAVNTKTKAEKRTATQKAEMVNRGEVSANKSVARRFY
jgi:hypothetical protein